jgi:hypothetical protein
MLDNNGDPRELFNLDEDALELFNLIEEEPAQTRRLEKIFAVHRDSIANDRLRPNTEQGYVK